MKLSTLILTGQSGSGKSTAIRALEDHGHFCVDNIPTALVERLLEMVEAEPSVSRLAAVMDVRGPHFLAEGAALLKKLRSRGLPIRLVYLEASEPTLLRRYSETRRKHPLDDGCGLHDAIVHERELLAPLRELADDTLDTTDMSPHELRDRVIDQLADVQAAERLKIALLSFGFKHGVPVDSDMVLDVRFLPNPYFDATLRPLTGLDPAVRSFVVSSPDGQEFLKLAHKFLTFLIPRYQREGKRYLTVAIGCTGGQHRSVAIAEALAASLSDEGFPVARRHRDRQETP